MKKTCWANGMEHDEHGNFRKKQFACLKLFEHVVYSIYGHLKGGPVIQQWVYTRSPPFFAKCSDKAGGNPACWSRAQGLMPSDSSAGATQYSSEV